MSGVSSEVKQWQKENSLPYRAEVAEDGKVSWYDAEGNSVYRHLGWVDSYPFTADERARVEDGFKKAVDEMVSATATPLPSETPVQAIPEANKTSFAGTTLKGNGLNFIILPESTQQTMDDLVHGSGATGSWGALCSVAATPEQLAETGVTTTEPGGGHEHVWRSLQYTAVEAHNPSKIDGVALADIMNSDPEVQSLGKQCVVMNSELTSAGAQEYPSATAGQYISSQLSSTVDLH